MVVITIIMIAAHVLSVKIPCRIDSVDRKTYTWQSVIPCANFSGASTKGNYKRAESQWQKWTTNSSNPAVRVAHVPQPHIRTLMGRTRTPKGGGERRSCRPANEVQ
jgi:hypothetical protein